MHSGRKIDKKIKINMMNENLLESKSEIDNLTKIFDK